MAEAYPTPEYKCLLCMKPYNQPKELPCNHTFCCSCLTSYIDKEHRTADEDRHYFPCPVCDKPTSPRDVNTDVNTWGTSFPINNLCINTTATTSDDQNCEECQRVGESNTAVVWCTGCTEMLCKDCKKYHERNKMTAKHRLVPSEDGGFCDAAVNEECHNHEGHTLEVYCLDHSSICCCICVAISHKNCNHIKPIDDVIKATFAGNPVLETAWENIKDEATNMLEDDESEMTSLNTKENEVSAKMTQKQLKDKFDDFNTKFQLGLADQCKVHQQQLSARMECVKKFQINAENSNILMTHLEKQGTDRQRFVMREKTKQQVSGHYRRLEQTTKRHPNTFDLKLDTGNVIDDIMKMTTIGNVDVISKISSTSQNAYSRIGSLLGTLMSTPSATTFADSTSASDLVGSPTKRPATVDVRTGYVSCVLSVDSQSQPGKMQSCLTGGMFTDDGELLTTDIDNHRLLLFDDKYRYKREYKVQGNPSDVTRGLDTDEILVSAVHTGVMRCTLRNGQLTVIETIKCKGQVYGIAVLRDNILVSTWNSIKVMSSDGTVKQSIQRGGRYYTPIATCISTSTFYYSDVDDVVCRRLDMYSDVEDYRYSDPGLKGPTGIGLDRDNNVYVCGYDSNNVYIISPDGSRGKVLVPRLSGIRCPYKIIVHPTKQEYVVTSIGEAISREVYRFSGNADVAHDTLVAF